MKKKKLFLYFLLPLFLLQFTCPGYSQTDSGIEVEIQLEPIATFTFSEIYRLKEDPDEVYKLSTVTISNDTNEKKELKIKQKQFLKHMIEAESENVADVYEFFAAVSVIRRK